MLLFSKLFPKLKNKSDKCRGVTSEADMLSSADKAQLDFNCKVVLLDDSELALNVKMSAKGQAVIDKVYSHLNLIEKDYFGLRFLDSTSQTHWLDPTKTVGAQVKTLPPHKFYFGVKFYAADPCKLHEEITRYQFFLQLKRDVLQGRLPVAFDLAAELSAYCVQSELGDYDPKRHSEGYISEFRFIPSQTEEFELRVSQLHKLLIGQVPAATEYRFLDKVKWLEMYGVDLHAVQGEGNIQYFLGLTPTGIVVYRNKNKVGNYFWPRLTKITFKGKFFMIRVRDKNNDENTYAFESNCKAACKHLWKCCIEHHAFFRLTSANDSYKNIGGRLFNFGSKYRYSGRTERQVLTDAQNRPPPKVVRRPSQRHQRRSSSEGRIQTTSYSHLPNPEMDSMVAATAVLTSDAYKKATYHRAEGYQSAPDSPRSTKSAPWLGTSKHKGGLYTSGRESPLSCRSEKMMFPKRIASGSESEGGYARRRGQHRYESETESEYVYEPYRSHNRAPADYTESESEAVFHQRQRRHRKSTESLPYSHAHWKEVHQRIQDGNNGSVTSMASDPTGGAKRRRNRRSRSPGNRRPPEELAQHFRYIDPAEEGITEEQMKEIGYEQVLTAALPVINVKKVNRNRHKPHKHRSYGELSERSVPERSSAVVIPDGEAPPPYMEDTARNARGRQRSQPNLNYAARPRSTHEDPCYQESQRSRSHSNQRSLQPGPPLQNPIAMRGLPDPSPLQNPIAMRGLPDPSPLQNPIAMRGLPDPSVQYNHSQYAHQNPEPTNKPNMMAVMAAPQPYQQPSPVNMYASPVMAAPQPYQQPSPITPSDPSTKHTRDDSGLGPEQDNGSLNSSSRMASPAGSISSHSNSLPQGHVQGHPQGHPQGHVQGYPQGHPQGHPSHIQGHPVQMQSHKSHLQGQHSFQKRYSPQQRSSFNEQVLSETTNHHNNMARKHYTMSTNPQRYHPNAAMHSYIPRSNNTFSPPASGSRYSSHNGTSRSHSEKTTEL